MSQIKTRALITTLIISVVGGYVFYLLNIPLPWMLGPLVFVNLSTLIAKVNIYWPINIRNAGLIVLGYIMGSPFTLSTLQQIMVQLPAMLATTVSTVLFSILIGYITH
ncbi:MAG: AbrB family transcriptional regulator, partial [Negativicutes bacterium]|nr:AbrB family transcriptional regulator [Negativicutes bacterium]